VVELVGSEGRIHIEEQQWLPQPKTRESPGSVTIVLHIRLTSMNFLFEKMINSPLPSWLDI
jgi:hypothetical protein